MLVVFARLLTMVARAGTGNAVVYTDPIPVGNLTFCDAVMTVGTLFAVGGSAPTLQADAEGSLDGISFFPIATLAISATGTGDFRDSDYVTAVFLRFKLTLGSTGSGDNLAVATFDLHANMTRK